MFKKFNKSSGAVSSIILILGVALLVVIIVVFFVIKISASKNTVSPKTALTANTVAVTPPAPVYQIQLGDVDFTLKTAINLGSVLAAKDLRYGQNLTTTEKFIEVVVGAQNKGRVNTDQFIWDVGNIVDSDGRQFVSINDRAYFYLPQPNLCGASMKPAFAPISCIKMYEVSKQSAGLKVRVSVTSPKKQEAFLDLNVR